MRLSTSLFFAAIIVALTAAIPQKELWLHNAKITIQSAIIMLGIAAILGKLEEK